MTRPTPTLLLLHGFPSSSHMFRNLIESLADSYHLIAPDHIGFGQSSMPSVHEFNYSFGDLTEVTEKLIAHLGLDRLSLARVMGPPDCQGDGTTVARY
ncbi:alpha/beta fold hydrolase [Mycolicibacterium tusciae]|uniref:alpha/beta fold hydrolase n=1 Tax=Mycolicibacterium tusciae TaxID=75922 RepID=UPI0002D4088C